MLLTLSISTEKKVVFHPSQHLRFLSNRHLLFSPKGTVAIGNHRRVSIWGRGWGVGVNYISSSNSQLLMFHPQTSIAFKFPHQTCLFHERKKPHNKLYHEINKFSCMCYLFFPSNLTKPRFHNEDTNSLHFKTSLGKGKSCQLL